MAIFPKIQSACPYKGSLADILDGEVCRLCKRQVFDLTDMSDDERVAFMRGCSGEVCVSYKLATRRVLAATVAVAAIGAPMAAAACDDATQEIVISTGGIKDPASVTWTENYSDRSIPDLPVTYEQQPKNAQSSAQSPQPARSHDNTSD